MDDACPRCGKVIDEEFVYCPYCGRGLKPSARSTLVSVAASLMLVSTVSSLIFLLFSTEALIAIHRWYPQLTAQQWFPYIQLFAILNVAGLTSGLLTSALTLTRRKHTLAVATALVLTACGGVAGTISLVIPDSNLTYSVLYYFLPLFTPSLIGVLLIIPKRAEFKE